MAASQELMAQISNADDDDDDDEVVRRGAGPTKHDLCSIIVESSYHMLGLINNLLDFERMESHQMQIEDIPFDLACELTKTIKVGQGSKARLLSPVSLTPLGIIDAGSHGQTEAYRPLTPFRCPTPLAPR